jgi:hypothetical protein
MDWAQILVILLAALFAVFIVVAIIIGILIIKVTRQIKSAASSAERTVQALEGSVNAFNKTALPLMVTKGIISSLAKRSKVKKSKENE